MTITAAEGDRGELAEPIRVICWHRLPVLLIIPFVLTSAAATLAAGLAVGATQTSAPKTETPAVAVPASPPPLRRTLPSGIRLIIVTEPGATRTAIELRVRVGSAMESPETNGLSHVIEHMVFKGTESGKPGDIDTAIDALGGEQLTARTSRDFTRFATVVPTANWVRALETIGDMVRHPAFRDADWANESSVIGGEMAQTDSLIDRSAYGDLAALAFEAADADRLPIMGSPESLARFTAADIRAFWTTWYRPENMTVVVVGGASADEAARAASRLFPAPTVVPKTGAPPVPAAPLPNPAASAAASAVGGSDAADAAESPTGIVRVSTRAAMAQGERDLITVTLAFPGPASTDAAALPVVETLLPLLAGENPTGSRSGRLGRTLVGDSHVALAVSAAYLPARRNGLFFLSATGTGETGARRLETALASALRRFAENPVSDDEVAIARAAAASDIDAEDATPAGHARRLADADARGIPADLADHYADRIRAVTTDAVRAAALHYLTPDRYFVAVLGGSGPIPSRSGVTREATP